MTLDVTLRMALVQGLGILGELGNRAGALVDQSARLAEDSPLASEILERGRALGALTQSVATEVFPGAARLCAGYNRTMATWRRTSLYLESVLAQSPHLRRHPQWLALMDIVTGPTSVDDEGFPQLVPATYDLFREQVPHLFGNGLELLSWLRGVEGVLKTRKNDVPDEAAASILRGVKALKAMALTASVTAPSDLWLARQILGTHKELGTLDRLAVGETIDPEEYAERHGLVAGQFSHDMEFLEARGYLERTLEGRLRARAEAVPLFENLHPVPKEFRIDMVKELAQWLAGPEDAARSGLVDRWFRFREAAVPMPGWIAGSDEIDLGYHLMPLVLALKSSGILNGVKQGQRLNLPKRYDIAVNVERVLQEAGLIRGGVVTELGERVFERGPGVMGIIGAYHGYLNQHEALLRAEGPRPWVERAANIFASRDANRKTFQEAVASLKRFMEETGYRPVNVVEHALGLGIATQEFVKALGAEGFHFFGADFEEAALAKARLEKEAGRLPANMEFVQADIGLPETLIRFIREKRGTPDGESLEPTVMIVGNGFHEVRHQTDDRMAKIFEAYREAGILLIFVEESGLTTDQLLRSAWNSYHAGFRWVHQTSGQGLRAPWPSRPSRNGRKPRASWSQSAEAGGYEIESEYSTGTRRLMPLDLPPGENPQISVTYFCVS